VHDRHPLILGRDAERTAQLTEAIARLQGSLATLAVLDAAVGDARAVLGSVRGLVPRK